MVVETSSSSVRNWPLVLVWIMCQKVVARIGAAFGDHRLDVVGESVAA